MLTLHTYFRGSASYRVRTALELKSLRYEPDPVHLVRGGEQHSAAFAALNPAELVPELVHEGLTITQSLAIIEYLDEIHPSPQVAAWKRRESRADQAWGRTFPTQAVTARF